WSDARHRDLDRGSAQVALSPTAVSDMLARPLELNRGRPSREDAPWKDANPGGTTIRTSPSEGTVATTHPLEPEPEPDHPPASPRRRIREAVLIGLLALTLNLAGNARISLWDRDEPRYA